MIDADAARGAMAQLAGAAEISVEAMAEGVLRLAVTRMAAVVYEISVGRGHDPRDFALVCFGGAGPLHACAIADELGIGNVVMPRAPGVFSAFGGLCAPLFRESMQTVLESLDESSLTDLEARTEAARDDIAKAFREEGLDPATMRLRREIDARYLGQAHEVTIAFPKRADVSTVTKLFEEVFEREFGRLDRHKPIEIVNLRVLGEIPIDPPPLRPVGKNGAGPQPRIIREVYSAGTRISAPVFERDALNGGAQIDGPAVVEEMSTTLYLPQGWRLHVGRFGECVLSRSSNTDGDG